MSAKDATQKYSVVHLALLAVENEVCHTSNISFIANSERYYAVVCFCLLSNHCCQTKAD